MGGLGSGGQNSKGKRLVEGQHWLDASDFKRRGLFHEGCVANLFWKGSDNEPGPSMGVAGGQDAITLSYAWRQGHEAWQRVNERVALVHHDRHFGGVQTYFLCPKCARTVKRLYGGGPRYLCRHCYRLVHASSQESPHYRAMRRNRKLRRRLGASLALGDWIGPKPKGMHQKTFDRIRQRIQLAETQINDDLLLLLGRLEQRRVNHVAKIRRQASSQSFWR